MTARPPGAVHATADTLVTDGLACRLRDRGTAVARRELATALQELEGLTPAQRRTVALMAARLAAGILVPASRASPAERAAVARLFDLDEHVRDER